MKIAHSIILSPNNFRRSFLSKAYFFMRSLISLYHKVPPIVVIQVMNTPSIKRQWLDECSGKNRMRVISQRETILTRHKKG